MKKILSLLAFFSLIILQVAAQHQCGFDDLHQELMASDPHYAAEVQASTAIISAMNQMQPSMMQVNGNDTLYEIPVVVHIIHTGNPIGGAYNPTDADVQDMIDVLNATYASTVTGWPSPSTGGVDMKLRFKLATRSPSCGPTTGINRVDGSFLSGYTTAGVKRYGSVGPSDADVKALSRWDNQEYYNIWVVGAIDGFGYPSGPSGGVAGYAYLPMGAPSLQDGTVILSAYVNDDPDDVATLSHEIGHAFGLYHTFDGDDGGSSCPIETNCATQNDEVCDTEPHIRSYGCPTGTNSCTSMPYNNVSYNIMNYTNCVNRFTPGQQARAIAIAKYYRKNLLHSAKSQPFPSVAITAASCTPTIINANNNLDVGPTSVELEGIYHESDGYTDDGDMVYVDNTCVTQTNLMAGQTYSIEVGTEGYSQKVKAYIDFNNDGAFASSEEILSSLTSSSGNQIHSATFTVPMTATSCVPLRMRVVSDRMTSATPSPCGALSYGQAEDYMVIIEGSDTVGIQITAGTNPSCPGTALSFAAQTSATSTITYDWSLNGTMVGTGPTYSTSTAMDGDVLTLTGYVASTCHPGTMDTITESLTILRQTNTNVQAALNILVGNDTICAGDDVVLQTVLQNGTNPSYQWMQGSTAIGTGTDTLQYMPQNGDQIYCLITDANSCFTGTISSDTVDFVVATTISPTASITVTPSFPICDGEQVSLVATVQNEGLSPSYSWNVNGTSVATGALNYTTSSLSDGDVINFTLASSLSCASDPSVTSNDIIADVDPVLPVSATAIFLQGSNTICSGDPIVMQGAITNGGSAPSFDWFVNGVFSAAGNPMTFNGISDGDVISLVATSSEECVSGNPANVSETITVNPYPSPLQITLVGNELRAYPPAAIYTWYGPNGLISGVNTYNYTPTINGQYYCIPTNPPCVGEPSNILEVYVLDNEILTLADFKLYPNPAQEKVTIESKDLHPTEIYLLSALGQRIALDYKTVSRDEFVIDVSDVVPGFYILEVHSLDRGVQYHKLQIQD